MWTKRVGSRLSLQTHDHGDEIEVESRAQIDECDEYGDFGGNNAFIQRARKVVVPERT
jgi:hypothetical protein